MLQSDPEYIYSYLHLKFLHPESKFNGVESKSAKRFGMREELMQVAKSVIEMVRNPQEINSPKDGEAGEWKSECPEEPGYYWCQLEDQIFIAEIIEYPSGDCFVLTAGSDERIPLDEKGALWMGPISEPALTPSPKDASDA